MLDAHAHKFNKLGLARHAGSTLFRATTIDTSKSTCVCMGKYRMQKIEICLCIHHGKIYESYWKKLCTGIQKSADYEYRRSLLKGIRKGHRSKFKESIPFALNCWSAFDRHLCSTGLRGRPLHFFLWLPSQSQPFGIILLAEAAYLQELDCTFTREVILAISDIKRKSPQEKTTFPEISKNRGKLWY